MQTEKSDYANKHNPLEKFNQHNFFVDFFGQLVHENATKYVPIHLSSLLHQMEEYTK